jgi:hypothetical protein
VAHSRDAISMFDPRKKCAIGYEPVEWFLIYMWAPARVDSRIYSLSASFMARDCQFSKVYYLSFANVSFKYYVAWELSTLLSNAPVPTCSTTWCLRVTQPHVHVCMQVSRAAPSEAAAAAGRDSEGRQRKTLQ